MNTMYSDGQLGQINTDTSAYRFIVQNFNNSNDDVTWAQRGLDEILKSSLLGDPASTKAAKESADVKLPSNSSGVPKAIASNADGQKEDPSSMNAP